MSEKISALIICRNEESVIERCLASLTWCDEIVVVDAMSTDRTSQICQAAARPWTGKVNFLQRPWTTFREQRNFSLDSASHPWVLVIDADEECTPELATRIRGILSGQSSSKQSYFKIRRQEWFLGRPIHWGVWNPSFQDRLFRREGIRYVNDIHEYPLFPAAPERIFEPLNHWPDFDPEKFLFKMNKYTTIEAKDRLSQGQRTNLFRVFTSGPAMFFKNFFYYKSYRDGVPGFIISLLEGISRTVRHIKMWQYSRAHEYAEIPTPFAPKPDTVLSPIQSSAVRAQAPAQPRAPEESK